MNMLFDKYLYKLYIYIYLYIYVQTSKKFDYKITVINFRKRKTKPYVAIFPMKNKAIA